MTKLKSIDFLNLKNYIKKELKVRSSDDAVNELAERLCELAEEVLRRAKQNSTENKRKTIMGRDIQTAVEKLIKKKELTWRETLKHVLKRNPTEIANIIDGVETYIRKNE